MAAFLGNIMWADRHRKPGVQTLSKTIRLWSATFPKNRQLERNHMWNHRQITHCTWFKVEFSLLHAHKEGWQLKEDLAAACRVGQGSSWTFNTTQHCLIGFILPSFIMSCCDMREGNVPQQDSRLQSFTGSQKIIILFLIFSFLSHCHHDPLLWDTETILKNF